MEKKKKKDATAVLSQQVGSVYASSRLNARRPSWRSFLNLDRRRPPGAHRWRGNGGAVEPVETATGNREKFGSATSTGGAKGRWALNAWAVGARSTTRESTIRPSVHGRRASTSTGRGVPKGRPLLLLPLPAIRCSLTIMVLTSFSRCRPFVVTGASASLPPVS